MRRADAGPDGRRRVGAGRLVMPRLRPRVPTKSSASAVREGTQGLNRCGAHPCRASTTCVLPARGLADDAGQIVAREMGGRLPRDLGPGHPETPATSPPSSPNLQARAAFPFFFPLRPVIDAIQRLMPASMRSLPGDEDFPLDLIIGEGRRAARCASTCRPSPGEGATYPPLGPQSPAAARARVGIPLRLRLLRPDELERLVQPRRRVLGWT